MLDLHVPIHHQHVIGLQVAMNNPSAVKIGQRLQLLLKRCLITIAQNIHRIVQEFHGEIRLLLLIEAIFRHTNDVGMAE